MPRHLAVLPSRTLARWVVRTSVLSDASRLFAQRLPVPRRPAPATCVLWGLCRQTMRSRIEPKKKSARSLRQHRELSLNYFRAHKLVSSGVVEGLKNKANITMKNPMNIAPAGHSNRRSITHSASFMSPDSLDDSSDEPNKRGKPPGLPPFWVSAGSSPAFSTGETASRPEIPDRLGTLDSLDTGSPEKDSDDSNSPA